ncbi:MAG TPA: outer membrane beta-barrel protein [Cytophagaceae bacterium]
MCNSKPFYIILLLAITNLSIGYAQRPNYKVKKPAFADEAFMSKQWWIGIRTGLNLTKAVPDERYSVFSSTDNNNDYHKSYQNFNRSGAVAGMEVTFVYKNISASFQPNYRRQRFVYRNSYEWKEDSTNNYLNLNFEQDHHLEYLEFPIFLKYDIIKRKIKPFIQAGFYYGTLINANKSVNITGYDQASGGYVFNSGNISMGARDLFIKSSIGFIGGAGVSYNLGNLKLIADINYRFGTHNITNTKNRFTDNRLAGSGDAMDDIKLRNLSFNFGVLFPMRFLITKYYKAAD